MTKPLAALLLTAAAGWGQSARSNWANLNALAPGTEVRVTLAGGRTVRGFLQQTTAGSLVLNAARSQETFPQADVKRVQSKKAGHRGRNTLIGLGAGTGAGLTAGAALDAKTSDLWFSNFGKVLFTSCGALIGTVVGVAWPTGGWREIYRAP